MIGWGGISKDMEVPGEECGNGVCILFQGDIYCCSLYVVNCHLKPRSQYDPNFSSMPLL